MIQELFQFHLLLFLLDGLLITLKITVATVSLSLVFGTILGVARFSRHPLFSRAAAVYIETVRNIPLLLFILAARFLTNLPPVYSSILAMTIFSSSIMAEIVRGGLNSVHKGQWEAARSQGFSYVQILFYIVLPQAFRNIIPPLVSQFTIVLKDTSYVWAIGIEELTGRGMIVMGKYGSTAQTFTIFGVIAATYFIISYSISVFARMQQTRLSSRSY